MNIIKKETISYDLEKLGLKAGDMVMVHSSLSSLGGYVEGGYDAIIDAFMDLLGSDGTLLMPALSYTEVNRSKSVFDIKNTPSCAGTLTEHFRLRDKVIRSMHPTHSVCALGKYAREITKNHHSDFTPVGPNSPFTLLPSYGGKILMLGCGLKPNTFMHSVEETAEVPYVFSHDPVEYTCRLSDETEVKALHLRHGFDGYEQAYDRIIGVLNRKDYSLNKVEKAKSYLFDSRILLEKALATLKDNPYYFVEPPHEIENTEEVQEVLIEDSTADKVQS